MLCSDLHKSILNPVTYRWWGETTGTQHPLYHWGRIPASHSSYISPVIITQLWHLPIQRPEEKYNENLKEPVTFTAGPTLPTFLSYSARYSASGNSSVQCLPGAGDCFWRPDPGVAGGGWCSHPCDEWPSGSQLGVRTQLSSATSPRSPWQSHTCSHRLDTPSSTSLTLSHLTILTLLASLSSPRSLFKMTKASVNTTIKHPSVWKNFFFCLNNLERINILSSI